MKRLDRDHYQLSSGREFYANCGIVGLAPKHEREGWTVSYGYDGDVFWATQKVTEYDGEDEAEDRAKVWTPEDRAELADYMIALWQQFKTDVI